TQNWANVLIGIARYYPDTLLTGYVYSLGQTNITVGFIPFHLPKIRAPYELYQKYFGTSDKEKVEQFFGTEIGFTKSCQAGSIGINALEPKGFRDCFDKGNIPRYVEDDETKRINFNIYQIWLLAMLNNEDLWEKAKQFAEILHTHTMSDKNAKKTKSQEVDNLLKTVKKQTFMEELIAVSKSSSEILPFEEIGYLVNSMPIDNVPYFLTLLRFQYVIISKKLNN
ncbi:MAG: hypothetical protein RR190_07700, partial [Bacteroidales bacterium]